MIKYRIPNHNFFKSKVKPIEGYMLCTLGQNDEDIEYLYRVLMESLVVPKKYFTNPCSEIYLP